MTLSLLDLQFELGGRSNELLYWYLNFIYIYMYTHRKREAVVPHTVTFYLVLND